MGYTAAGGPKGLGAVNNTAQTASDFNQMITLIARMGNLRVETTASRDAIPSAQLYEGLHIYNTTTKSLEKYSGSGWVSYQPVSYVTAGASAGAIANTGDRLTVASLTIPAAGVARVRASLMIYPPLNAGQAGQVYLMAGGVEVASRRWHNHNHASTLMPVISIDRVIAAGTEIKLEMTNDGSSAGGVEVWDADLRVTLSQV